MTDCKPSFFCELGVAAAALTATGLLAHLLHEGYTALLGGTLLLLLWEWRVVRLRWQAAARRAALRLQIKRLLHLARRASQSAGVRSHPALLGQVLKFEQTVTNTLRAGWHGIIAEDAVQCVEAMLQELLLEILAPVGSSAHPIAVSHACGQTCILSLRLEAACVEQAPLRRADREMKPENAWGPAAMTRFAATVSARSATRWGLFAR